MLCLSHWKVISKGSIFSLIFEFDHVKGLSLPGQLFHLKSGHFAELSVAVGNDFLALRHPFKLYLNVFKCTYFSVHLVTLSSSSLGDRIPHALLSWLSLTWTYCVVFLGGWDSGSVDGITHQGAVHRWTEVRLSLILKGRDDLACTLGYFSASQVSWRSWRILQGWGRGERVVSSSEPIIISLINLQHPHLYNLRLWASGLGG